MKQHDAESWQKAVGARQDLVGKHAGDPNVTLIDIGYPPQECGRGDQVVIRVHVTEQQSTTRGERSANFEREVNGVPVCVVRKR